MVDPTTLPETVRSLPRTRWPTLDAALDAAMLPWRSPSGPLTILFSGGVDSGILAWELRQRPATTLATVGLAGSVDLDSARTAAAAIGLPWVGTEVSGQELEEAFERGREEFGGLPAARQSLFLALAVAIEHAPGPDLLCGQGADELFLGYAHYRGLGVPLAAERSASDLTALREVDWPLTVRIASRRARRIHAPFLDPGFVAATLEIPTALRSPEHGAKALWRAWALGRGLPPAIAHRPKRAMQYGTGIDRWVRRRGTRPTRP
ncbi:MAG TPA: asparagine synthase-related protein [Thermoplasmata archaeon]|nr:asparagine synthase-related protein [Thermoplasmata archaeon]